MPLRSDRHGCRAAWCAQLLARGSSSTAFRAVVSVQRVPIMRRWRARGRAPTLDHAHLRHPRPGRVLNASCRGPTIVGLVVWPLELVWRQLNGGIGWRRYMGGWWIWAMGREVAA